MFKLPRKSSFIKETNKRYSNFIVIESVASWLFSIAPIHGSYFHITFLFYLFLFLDFALFLLFSGVSHTFWGVFWVLGGVPGCSSVSGSTTCPKKELFH